MALEDLSDQELDALLIQSEPAQPTLETMSDQELDALIAETNNPEEEQGALESIGNFIDRFSGAASARTFISELQQGKDASSAFEMASQQLLSPQAPAPSGEQIAVQAGISQEPLIQPIERPVEVIPRPGRQVSRPIGKETEIIEPKEGAELGPSAADIAGLGIDIAADPSFLVSVPLKVTAKGLRLVGAAGKIESAGKTLKKLANQTAFKATGAMLKDFRKNRLQIEELGKRLLDDKLIKAGDSVKQIAKRTSEKLEETGQIIGDIYTNAEKLVPQKIDFASLSNKIEIDVLKDVKGRIGSKKAINDVTELLDELAEAGSGNLAELITKRREIDDLINWSKRNAALPLTQQTFKSVRNKINDEAVKLLKVIDESKGTNFAEDILTANKKFSELKTINNIASDRVSREATNRFFSLGDRITGGAGIAGGAVAGGAPGALIGGAILSGAAKVARTRGGSTAAKFLNFVGNILNQSPDLLGKYTDRLIRAGATPERFAATVLRLQKTDPEFKEQVNKIRFRRP